MNGSSTGAAAIHSDRRLPALTGLRIFATLFVYFNHVGPPAGCPAFLAHFMESGYCGVTIFFVLSGFVLAYNYFDGMVRPKASGIYEFFVARVARLYPLYLLILLFIVLEMHAAGVSVAGWWRNALAIQAWSPNLWHAFSFDTPAWSVSIEFFLYACFPLLVPLVAKLHTLRRLLVAEALVVALIFGLAGWFVVSGKGNLSPLLADSSHRWLYRMPLTRLGDFTLGIIAARIFVMVRHDPRATRLGRVLAPAAALAILGLMFWHGLLSTTWSWDSAYALPAICLIFGLAVAPGAAFARFLSLSWIVLLGEASYAFYLVHVPAMEALGGHKWMEGASLSRIIFEAMVLGGVLTFSVGLHLTVEMPLRKRVRGWLSLRPGSPLSRLAGRRERAAA